MYLKMLPVLLIILFLPVILVREEKINRPVFNENRLCEDRIEKIIEDNKDKKLNVQKKYDNKFVYLEFENGEDNIINYFLNAKTGEETSFSEYLKKDMIDEFDKKVSELIYLKYPKFIADVISKNDIERIYQIKENEIVIYFEDIKIEPQPEEKLYLVVNYNEIKDFIDFTCLLDATYENENGYNYNKSKKTVALTFDDGPSGEKTNKIVGLLEQNKAHATFFMVGNKMTYGASTIKNVLEKGNEIGSHSYAHKSMKRQKLKDLLASEEKTHSIYYNITGKEMIYTRPPYGAINNTVKNALDTIFITWNLDTEDWLHRDKQYIVDYVMENIEDGDIILMHDSYDSTVLAVEELLPKLYAKGYQVVSVSELAQLKERDLEKNTIYRSLKEI